MDESTLPFSLPEAVEVEDSEYDRFKDDFEDVCDLYDFKFLSHTNMKSTAIRHISYNEYSVMLEVIANYEYDEIAASALIYDDHEADVVPMGLFDLACMDTFLESLLNSQKKILDKLIREGIESFFDEY